MLEKYNLALIPISKKAEIITLAQSITLPADGYVLGEKSLPHVTLYQFEAEKEKWKSIWEQMKNNWREKPIMLTFNKFSYVTFDEAVFWISLLPHDIYPLFEMHKFIANSLKWPIKISFDPHLTLINTKDKEYKKESCKLENQYHPIQDTFVLALGKSDNLGQFLEVLEVIL